MYLIFINEYLRYPSSENLNDPEQINHQLESSSRSLEYILIIIIL